jgi:hypothetical protein
MLRIYRAPPTHTLGMLQPGPESQHPDRERQPLVRESEHTGHLSEHIGSIRRLPALNSEHNGRERLPQTVRMLQSSGVFLPLELGMLRLGGEWQNPTGGWEKNGRGPVPPPWAGGGWERGEARRGEPQQPRSLLLRPFLPPPDLSCNHLENSLHILENLMVPEPEHPKALIRQPGIPGFVSSVTKVLPAVDLDHQPPREAGKVNDVRTYGDLATESRSERPTPKLPPKLTLGRFSRRREHRGCWGSPLLASPRSQPSPAPGGGTLRPQQVAE